MSRSSIPLRLAWLLVGASLALHLLTVYAYSRQPDRLAAFTVMPIWAWGGLGLLLSGSAFYFLRAPLSLVVTTLWTLTVLLGADEARVIANLGTPGPRPGPAAEIDGRRPIRVITLNTALFTKGDPTEDLAKWDPDIVLLQETPPALVGSIARRLYDGQGDFRGYAHNGVATRWSIPREVRNPHPDFREFNHNVTVRLPDGREIEVVNLHLSSAATDLRLWQRESWRRHMHNRRHRRGELAVALGILKDTTSFPGHQAVILGGDFNTPPGDPIHRALDPDFTDAFLAVGTGWGDTFHRRVPILRIDRLYVTRHLTPVRCRAITTRHSDHRMVVADLLLE